MKHKLSLYRNMICAGALLFTVHGSAAAAVGPADSPAPMFHFNAANTGQSTQYGTIAKPNIVWTFRIGSNNTTLAPQSLALSNDGLLYTPGMYALHTDNGSVAWHSATGWRDSHSALDAAGREFSTEAGQIYARNAATGAPIWTAATNASDGDPVKIGPDGTVYASTFAGTIYAYSGAGQLKFTVSNGSVQYGEISHIPAIDAANNIYYSGATGLRSLNSAGQVRWTTNWNPGGSSVVMLAPNGNVVWQRDDLVEVRDSTTGLLISSFSFTGGLQAIDTDGNLYFTGGVGIEKKTITGQSIWKYARSSMDIPLTVDAAGNVFCGDQLGNVIALSSSGIETWEVHVTDGYPALYNTPPIIGPLGEIYVLEQHDGLVAKLSSVPEPDPIALFACASIVGGLFSARRSRP